MALSIDKKRKLLKALSPQDIPSIVAQELIEKVDEAIKNIPVPKDGKDGKDGIGVDGEDGKTPSKEELVSLIKPLIPEPIKGKDGVDDKDAEEVDLQKLQREIIKRIPHGGGNANRQININSLVMSTKYTDIDFQNSPTIGWTVTDDDTNKRVIISVSNTQPQFTYFV